jgi:hypothetical protein
MRVGLALAVVTLLACGSEETAVVPAAGCVAPEVALADGRCMRPGARPEDCGAGFVHDGEYGCEPVLPEAPCAPGTMAVPGETACREVAPCGEGSWGDIPVDGATVYVDADYGGGDGDGSEARPWPTIGEAIAAAAPGALVAIAAGSYVGNVVVTGKPVRLRGVCPAQVTIVGTAAAVAPCPAAAVCVTGGAHGSELRGVAIRGDANGIVVSAAEDLRIEEVWLHDNALRGIDVEVIAGPASVHVVGSLLEQNHDVALLGAGTALTVERSVIRGTQPAQDGEFGRGLSVQACLPADGCTGVVRASLSLVGSVIEQSHDIGVALLGADAVIDTTVIRGTLPRAVDQTAGRGLTLEADCSPACDPATSAAATVTSSLVADSLDNGIFVLGSQATVVATTVRDTRPRASDQREGRGLVVQQACNDAPCSSSLRSNVTVQRSLFERNTMVGLHVSASDAVVEGVVVRDTQADGADAIGRGLQVQARCDDAGPCAPGLPSLVAREVFVESSYEVGLVLIGATTTMDDSVIRATQPRPVDGTFGRGVVVQIPCTFDMVCDPTVQAPVLLRTVSVEESHDMGIVVVSAGATVERSRIATTRPRTDGSHGDGVGVVADDGFPASVDVLGSRIESSARAGLASFGARAALSGSVLVCNAFDLNAQDYLGTPFSFDDAGGNACGCPEPDGPCKIDSAELSPPQPLD